MKHLWFYVWCIAFGAYAGMLLDKFIADLDVALWVSVAVTGMALSYYNAQHMYRKLKKGTTLDTFREEGVR